MRALPASLFLVALAARADFDPSQWRFRKAVDVTVSGLSSVHVDRQLFAASRAGLPDLRLICAGAEIAYVLERTGNREVIAAAAPMRTEEREPRRTVLAIDVGAANMPHDLIRIESPAPYFYRDAEVEAGTHGKEWTPVTRGALYRLPAGESLALSFPEREDRFVRLCIFNHDDAPLPVTKLCVESFDRRVRFIAQRAGRYWLYYGNAAARRPVYDLARVLAQQPDDRGTILRAEAQQANPEYHGVPGALSPWSERHPGLLYVTLAGAVAALGYIILRFRRAVSR